MSRSEKIIAFLKAHGCDPSGPDWNGGNFVEKHFFLKGELIIVRVHTRMNGMIEVFHVDSFFCAGDENSPSDKTPPMDTVLDWLGKMLEGKWLSLAAVERKESGSVS